MRVLMDALITLEKDGRIRLPRPLRERIDLLRKQVRKCCEARRPATALNECEQRPRHSIKDPPTKIGMVVVVGSAEVGDPGSFLPFSTFKRGVTRHGEQ